MASFEEKDHVVLSTPEASVPDSDAHARAGSVDERISLSSSSRSGSTSEGDDRQKLKRPQLSTRKSSGTIIVSRDAGIIEAHDEHYDEGDARTMSPRRSSEEVDQLEEDLRSNMIEQSRQLQANLLTLVDRVESVKAEHEKLEGGNRFLQSYIGELMQTSKITAAGAAKNKGKNRGAK